MKITCPSCSAKYSIADEKVADRLAKIRCRKCGTTIVIDGKVSPASVYAADAGPEATAPSSPSANPGEYSVDFGDNDQRSMTVAQLVEAYNRGEVTADTYIWSDGMDDWKPLGEVDDVVGALHAASGGGASAPQVSAPSSPFDAGASASPWANEAAPKAAVRAGTADLFGGFDSAGSEEDVTTSAPVDEAPAPQPTGARNESSVLFSLSALTSAAEKEPASPLGGFGGGSSKSNKEDSGLIDLKALTSQAGTDKPMDNPLMGSSPLGFGAPLGLGAPLGGGLEANIAPSMHAEPQQKSRSGLYIGGGIAVAALVIALAIVFASGGNKETPAAAAQPTADTATAAATTATPPPAPTPTMTAEAPATGTAVAEEKAPEVAAAPKPAPGAAAPRPAPRPKPGPGAAAPAPAPAPKPAAAPAPAPKPAPAKKCNCPPGDLMCAMRCRAG